MNKIVEKVKTMSKKQMVAVAIVIVLAILCLTMCGRGGAKSEHAALLEMLERGEYQSAHYYIDNLKAQAIAEGKQEEEKESNLPVLYGEWTLTSIYEGKEQIEKVSFDEDGTCKMGEKSLKWRMRDEYENGINIDISEGENICYRASVNVGGKEPILDISLIKEDGNGEGIGNYRNLALYEEIEITPENWDQYFELVTEGKFSDNAFGEFESFTHYQYLALKREYVDRISSSLSKLAMELDFTYGRKGCKLDKDNKSYTLTDRYEVDDYDHESSIYEFHYNNHEGEADYNATIMSSYYNEDEKCLVSFKTDMKVLRTQGSIYLLK